MIIDAPVLTTLPRPASAAVLDVRDARILIVDDEDASRLMCRTALESEGYEILEAGDGEEAVRVFRDHRPELILMDAVMPKMSGIAALEAIRRLPGGSEIPVLMVTGFNDETAANAAFERGATDFIPKPVNWAVLRQRVRRTISGRRAEREVNHLAYHDALTGLPNRRLFLDRLERATTRSRRDGSACALLFVDLDDFKIVNDEHGHEVGDDLLKRVSDDLRQVVRANDTVARFGGDEFNILLENVEDVAEAEEIARRVGDVLSRPHAFGGGSATASASIGIALFPDHATEPATLVKCADRAMYRAKALGGGRFVRFVPAGDETVRTALPGREELARLFESGAIAVDYTPRTELVRGTHSAWLAQAVWTERGGDEHTRAPILLADRTGLSLEFAIFMLERGLTGLPARPTPVVPLAIELSPAQVAAEGLESAVHTALERHDLPATALEVVVATGGRCHLPGEALATLGRLAGAGVGVTLAGLAVNDIPIEFLASCPANAIVLDARADRQLLSAWSSAAHALERALIADGILDPAVLPALASVGFTAAQGPGLTRALDDTPTRGMGNAG